jgi:hypothetical protein
VTGFAWYFMAFGILPTVIGIAVLLDWRGWGRRWEEGVNRNSAYVSKLAHLPWDPNPSLGPTWRRFVAGFFVILGLLMIVAVFTGHAR